MTWNVRSITQSDNPSYALSRVSWSWVPLFLVLFAAAYYMMSQSDASNFTSPLTRSDALYFTVTIFSTVGFGDISPAVGIPQARRRRADDPRPDHPRRRSAHHPQCSSTRTEPSRRQARRRSTVLTARTGDAVSKFHVLCVMAGSSSKRFHRQTVHEHLRGTTMANATASTRKVKQHRRSAGPTSRPR